MRRRYGGENERRSEKLESRKLPVPVGIHSGERRLRHRHRQRVEIPLRHRCQRRRRVRAVLHHFPHHHGRAHPDHGAGGGPGQPQERRGGLPGPGAQGQPLACPWVAVHHRLLPADDVLHHRLRLDAGLLLQIRRRHLQRHGARRRGHRMDQYAGQPRRDGAVDGPHRGGGLHRVQLRPAEGSGADQQVDDDLPAGPDRDPGRQQPDPGGRHRGREVLSAAGL